MHLLLFYFFVWVSGAAQGEIPYSKVEENKGVSLILRKTFPLEARSALKVWTLEELTIMCNVVGIIILVDTNTSVGYSGIMGTLIGLTMATLVEREWVSSVVQTFSLKRETQS